jgi:hypothetical protein
VTQNPTTPKGEELIERLEDILSGTFEVEDGIWMSHATYNRIEATADEAAEALRRALSPVDGGELREALHSALCKYKMNNMGDEDEQPYPLIDLCSNEGTTIDTGRAELFMLADYLSKRLLALPTPLPEKKP